jgi:hypothetical protein
MTAVVQLLKELNAIPRHWPLYHRGVSFNRSHSGQRFIAFLHALLPQRKFQAATLGHTLANALIPSRM